MHPPYTVNAIAFLFHTKIMIPPGASVWNKMFLLGASILNIILLPGVIISNIIPLSGASTLNKTTVPVVSHYGAGLRFEQCQEIIKEELIMDSALGLILLFPFLAVILMLLIASLVWVYRDAERRGKSGVLVALLVLFLDWPVSLLLWLVFRPEQRLPA